MNREELMYKATVFKNESEQIEKHLDYVNNLISELKEIFKALNRIKKDKENKTILAQIGKGIYIKSKIEEEKFYINVGSNIVVKKTADQTIKMIESQIEKLNHTRMHLSAQLEQYAQEFHSMLKDLEKLKTK